MPKKNIIIIAILLILALLAAASLYFVFIKEENGTKIGVKEKYPDNITGVISFFTDAKTGWFMAEIKTDKYGKLVILPAMPKLFYDKYGINDGQSVKINGAVGKDGVVNAKTLDGIDLTNFDFSQLK